MKSNKPCSKTKVQPRSSAGWDASLTSKHKQCGIQETGQQVYLGSSPKSSSSDYSRFFLHKFHLHSQHFTYTHSALISDDTWPLLLQWHQGTANEAPLRLCQTEDSTAKDYPSCIWPERQASTTTAKSASCRNCTLSKSSPVFSANGKKQSSGILFCFWAFCFETKRTSQKERVLIRLRTDFVKPATAELLYIYIHIYSIYIY